MTFNTRDCLGHVVFWSWHPTGLDWTAPNHAVPSRPHCRVITYLLYLLCHLHITYLWTIKSKHEISISRLANFLLYLLYTLFVLNETWLRILARSTSGWLNSVFNLVFLTTHIKCLSELLKMLKFVAFWMSIHHCISLTYMLGMRFYYLMLSHWVF